MSLGKNSFVEVAEELGFDFELFGGGFDDEVAVVEGVEDGGSGDAGAGFVGLLLGELGFGYFAGEVVGDGGEAAFEGGHGDVAEEDFEAGAGADVGDSVAHGAGAEDSDGFDRGA